MGGTREAPCAENDFWDILATATCGFVGVFVPIFILGDGHVSGRADGHVSGHVSGHAVPVVKKVKGPLVIKWCESDVCRGAGRKDRVDDPVCTTWGSHRMPYVKLAGSKAREGRSGLARRVVSVVVAGALAALVGLLGAPEPAQAIPEQTVSTVSPSGTTINLFDYWTTDNKSNDINGIAGINAGHQLKFNGGAGSDIINKWTGSAARMSYVSNTLVDGYPQISSGYHHGADFSTGSNYYAESLAYLFDASIQAGKESHLGVSGLLQAVNGYYEYDSAKNFASYDSATNAFKVYSQPAVSFKNTVGMFFPFNSASQVSANTEADADGNSLLNHHFGLSMSTQFIQPAEGGTAGVTTYNGQTRDMEFEFSGDDDVWVYIDDVLVGDLGGIHDAASLNINFHSGDVSVNGSSEGTLKSLFAAAGKSTDDFDGNTFKADSQHSLKFFYLERGAYASDMHLRFNLVTKPISEVNKVDQNGNPVQGAEFNLYEADDDYTKGALLATGTTDANGQLVFTSVTDHSVISFDDEAKKGVTHFVLEEGNVPAGYRTSLMASGDTMRLEYVKSAHPSGENMGGALVSPIDVHDGSRYDRMWLNGGYVATKETITAPSDLNVIDADKDKGITPSSQTGVMFAVTFMKGDDGTWKPIVGNALSGYESVNDTGISGVVKAAQRQGGSTFALTASGQHQVELADLPGDIRDYAYIRANDDMESAKYVVAVYYTTASSLSGVTSANTVRLNTDNFNRQFASKLLVTNVQNRLFVQKVDEGGNPVDGATFSLYSASSVETDAEGNYRLRDGAKAIDSATTAARTFPYTLDGSACFPVDSANKTPLENGTYYLAETAAPDGYLANDTVTKVIVDDTGVYVDAGKEGDGVRSMSGPGSLLSTLSQYGTNDEVDQTLASIKGTLESATEGQPSLLWGPCTAKGVTPADVNDNNPMRMKLDTSESSEGNVLQYVKTDGGLPIIYADTGINRMRIQQDGTPSKGDDLGDLQLNHLFTSATGVEYTDKRLARLEVTKQVTSADGTTAPTTYVDAQGQTQDLTFEFTFKLPKNGILGGDLANTQEYDAQVFDAAGNAVGTTFKLKDGSTHAIKAGETIRVYGLSAGDQFSVTETGKQADKGFSLVSRKQGNAEVEGEGDSISGTILKTDATGGVTQNNRLTFTNRYAPTAAKLADGSFVAKKTLTGRAWTGDDSFTIRLKAAVGTPMPDGAKPDDHGDHLVLDRPATKADLASANDDTTNALGFGDITYATPGIYIYTINELIPDARADGMTYSGAEYRLTVTVTDDGAGSLHAQAKLEQRSEDVGDGRGPADVPSYEPVADNKTATFTNTYNKTQQSITFEATKTLEDASGAKPLADGEFVFSLEAVGGFKDSGKALPLPTSDAYEIAAADVPMPQGVTSTSMTTRNNSTGVVAFPSITFTAVHDANRCYVYRISETNTREAGVTYDDTQYYYVVRVAKTGAGINTTRELYKADGTPEQGRPHFKNAYAVQSVLAGPIAVQKTLDGRAWGEGETFDFTLTPANDETSSAITSGYVTGVTAGETTSIAKPADASGQARGAFQGADGKGTLTFKRPGTYTFAVSEAAGTAGNVAYDDHASTVTFKVTDTGEAETPGGPSKLAVSVAYDNRDATTPSDRAVTDAAAFTNTYRASVSYAGINVTKTMLGRDLVGRDVKVHVAGVELDGRVASTTMSQNLDCPDAKRGDTVLLSANGSTSLLAGTLTQAQAGNTYAFRVYEDNSGSTIGGTSYDTDKTGSALVTLYVGADNAGSLYTVTSVYKGSSVDELLSRTHGSLTSADVDGLGAPLQRVDSRGASDDADSGDGTVAAYASAKSQPVMPTVSFTNSYSATLDYAAKGGLDVEKTLEQQGGKGNPRRSFGFVVKAQDSYVADQGGQQLVTTRQQAADKLGIPADSGQAFSTGEMGYGSKDVSLLPGGDLTFTQDDAGNVYTYTVSEAKPNPVPAGYTYDDTTYTVTISVDDNGDGTLRATTTVTRPTDGGGAVTVSQSTCTSASERGAGKTTIPFNNSYEIAESSYATYAAKVKKVVSGKDADEEFSFTLSASDEDTKRAIDDGTVSADGLGNGTYELHALTSGTIRRGEGQDVTFATMRFSKVGTYRFKVLEEQPTVTSQWHYDSHTLFITVNVYDNGGRLEARATTSSDAGGATFSNTYKASTTLGAQGGIDVVKTLSGRQLREGQFSFAAEGANDDAKAKMAKLAEATDGRVTIKNDDPVTDANGVRASYTNILDDIEFDSLDADKPFQFKIWEVNDGQSGYAYDASYYVVTVTPHLTSDGSALYIDASTQRYDRGGKADGDPVSVSSKGGATNIECAFENSYKAAGELTGIAATKTLSGRNMKAGEFNFNVVLIKNNGRMVVVNEAKNEAAPDGQRGAVDVPAIRFALGKHDDAPDVVDLMYSADNGLCTKVFNDDGSATYTFECALVEDVSSLPDGVRPTTGTQPTRLFEIVVRDNGDGTLSPSVTYGTGNSLDFFNTYDKVKTIGTAAQPNVDIDGQLLSVGSTYSYTIRWVNNATDGDGHSCAADVSITDELPAGLELVSASDGGTLGADGRTVSWTLAQRAANTDGSVTATVRVTSAALGGVTPDASNVAKLENTATVKVGDRAAYTSAPVTNYVPMKSVAAGDGTPATTAQVGEELTYTVGWRNATDGIAVVTIKDTLPANTAYVEGSAGTDVVYDASSNTITWALANRRPAEEGTVSFKVRVLPAAAGTTLVNEATVRPGNAAEVSTNRVTTRVGAGSLVVTKQVTGDSSLSAGKHCLFSFKVSLRDSAGRPLDGSYACSGTYDGGRSAEGFQVFDGKTFSLGDGDRLVVANLPAGATYTVEEDPADGYVTTANGQNSNAATGKVPSGSAAQAAFENNYGATGTLAGAANLRVTKRLVDEDGSECAWDADDAFTFTLAAGDVATRAAVDAGSVVLPDDAGGLVIRADTDGHAATFGDIEFKAAGTFTFDVSESRDGALRPSTTYDASVKHVRVSVEDNGNGTLTARLAPGSDPLSFENVRKTSKRVYQANDDDKVSLDGRLVSAGEELTYELTWVNNTDGDANVSVTDMLPDGVEFVSASDGGALGERGKVTWDLGTKAANTSGSVTLTVRVMGKDGPAGVDRIDNTGTITVGDNSYDTDTVTVWTPRKSVSASGGASASDGVAVGDVLEFGIGYRNDGDVQADVTVTDVLDAGLEPVSGSVSGAEVSQQDGHWVLTWTIADVAPGASGSVSFSAKVGEKAAARVDNTATVKVGDRPAVSTNPVSVEVNKASLTISKTVVRGDANRDFTFDVELTNADGTPFAGTLAATRLTRGQADASAEGVDVTFDEHGRAQVSLKGGQSLEFSRLATGVGYRVTEEGTAGYTACVNGTATNEASGTLAAGGATVNFTNTYGSSLNYGAAGGLTLEKTLTGHAMQAGQFEFTLRPVDADGAVGASESAALLGIPEQGKVFASPAADAGVAAPVNLIPDGLVLKQDNAGKTYAYELTETKGGGTGYTNDTAPHAITISVADNGDGTLTATTVIDGATYTYKTGEVHDADAATVRLTNKYAAAGTASIAARKQLDGRAQKAEEFHFTVTDAAGKPVATGTNEADGTITFDHALAYTQADVGQHAYTVTETGKMPQGVTGVVTQLRVTVTVADNGDGTLSTSVAYPDEADHLTFVNEYGAGAKATVSMNGSKVYKTPAGEGYQPPSIEGAYEFTLKGQDDAPMPAGSDGQQKTVRNSASNVDFGTIDYTMADAGKTYTYTVSEAATGASPSGVSTDGSTKTVLVSVVDNHDGTVGATVTDGDGAALGADSKFSFTNEYKVTGTSATVTGTKRLSGRDLAGGEFTFELLDEQGNQVATTTNDADGNLSFGLGYDKPGEHTYTVREVVPDGGMADGVTYDTREFSAHVSVTDNGAGALEASVTYPDGDIAFENAYAPAATTATISATKRLEGAALSAGQFTFQLTDAETGEVVQTAPNAKDGSVTFLLPYTADDAGKTFTYKVSEVDDGQVGVTYDGSSHTVTVQVADDGHGRLVATVSSDEALAFTNRYDAGGHGGNTGGETGGNPDTPADKQLPQTGDPLADAAVEATLAVAGLAVIAAAILVRRRHR